MDETGSKARFRDCWNLVARIGWLAPRAGQRRRSEGDRDLIRRTTHPHRPDATVIVLPRSATVPSEAAETAPTQRDRHRQLVVREELPRSWPDVRFGSW
jgi:hypothetical protein